MARPKKRKNRKRNRGKAPAAAAPYTPPMAQTQPPARAGLITAAVIGWFCLFPLFWYVLAPLISAGIGEVPVVNTIAGWLPGGLAAVYTGVLLMVWEGLPKPSRDRQTAIAITLWCLGLITLPMFEAELFVGYFAGLYASTFAMLAWIPAWGLIAVAQRPFTHTFALSHAARGWGLIAGAAATLMLGAGPIRYWF
ncbi:hypothetical protein [Actinokineospora pegani]|uniref:hypothetical protein n=1 Tax=Actinokineospora pegani TaxID=2654637 RepID=UPI0012E9FA54|nr:hypothetical protein [Actinokineospora pegani]